jgi:hypothetical protein
MRQRETETQRHRNRDRQKRGDRQTKTEKLKERRQWGGGGRQTDNNSLFNEKETEIDMERRGEEEGQRETERDSERQRKRRRNCCVGEIAPWLGTVGTLAEVLGVFMFLWLSRQYGSLGGTQTLGMQNIHMHKRQMCGTVIGSLF